MKVDIEYNLSVGKNADKKYKLRDRYKTKLKGLEVALDESLKKLDKLKLKEQQREVEDFKKIENRNKYWYEKFRWFFTKNGLLVLAGRDAKNNEQLVKKYLQDNDLYFHADVHGAPHTVIRNENNLEITQEDKEEAAIFAACYSSAWKSKIFSVDVYSVNSNQVTKTAKSGESLSTGAFVISGKREYFRKNDLLLTVGFDKDKEILICGPKKSISNYSNILIDIKPGDLKKSDVAKQIYDLFLENNIKINLDELISLLPAGESNIL